MKKYFFGLAAVIAAIAFSAFTVKPTTTQSFYFDSSSFSFSQANVQNPDSWLAGTIGCTGDGKAACVLQDVDQKFYHLEGLDMVLNSATRPSSEQNDVQYTITATQGNTSGIYLVSSVPTLGGTIDNKQ